MGSFRPCAASRLPPNPPSAPRHVERQTSESMRTYQRLMRRKGGTTHEEVEQSMLVQDLACAPGVQSFSIIERHSKGGYRVALDISSVQLDEFIAHLEARNWMSVL